MEKIIKRLGLLLPVLLMVLALLPGAASAEGNEASVTVGETVTPYATFLEAVNEANASQGSTVTLLQNVTVSSTVEITSADLTLDLNGFQVLETLGYKGPPIFRVASGAKLTVTDLSDAQTGEIGYFYDDQSYDSCSGIENNGTLVVEAGTVTGDPGIHNYGTVTLQGGIARGSYSGASGSENSGVWSISGNVYLYSPAKIINGLDADNTSVMAYGGQMTSVRVHPGSTLYAQDTYFGGTSGHMCMSAEDSSVELLRCEIECLVPFSALNCTTKMTDCTINGGYIFSDGCMKVDGGSLTATNLTVSRVSTSHNTFTISNGAEVSVYGATFTNGIQVGGGVLNDVLPEGWDYTDKDGNPITFADTDTKTADNETYYIERHKVASVTDADGNTTRHLTLADAVAAAQTLPGSTVKPLENIELDSRIEITSGTFTLDLNGCEVSLDEENDNHVVYLGGSNVDLLIKDSSDAGTGALVGRTAILVDNAIENGRLQIDSGNFVGTVDAAGLFGGKITINGGTFIGDRNALQPCSSAEIAIYGGYFAGGEEDFWIVQNSAIDHQTVTLYGGIFEDGISMDCSWADLNDLPGRCYFYVDAQGNKVIPNDGDMENAQVYTVRKFVEATVTVGDETTEYPYLSEALAAAEANPGSVLKLQKDFNLSAPLEITTGGFTFDLNGHTLSAEEQDALQVAENASLTLTDSADEPGSVGSVNNAGNLRLENISGSSLTSTGDVTLAGNIALPDGIVLVDGAQLKLDDLAGTNTFTVELQDADGNFATGAFASAADGSALDETDAARFTTTRAPGYVVQANDDGKLEIALVTVEILVGVIWEDSEDADGIRPETVTVAAQRDGQTVATKNISEGTEVFVLAKYDGETEISYTISFPDVEGYEKKVDGNGVTYSHVPAPTQPPATNGSANTADFAMPGLWAVVMLTCVMGAVTVCKRREI